MLILITDKCTLSCKHCMHSSGPNNKSVMDKELFEMTVDKAEKLGASVINIAGGEPTTVETETLKHYLEYSLSKGFITTLESNGSFLKDQEKVSMLGEIAKKYGMFYIQISAFKEYYTNRDETIEYLEKCELKKIMGLRIGIADESNSRILLTALGRSSNGEMLEKAKEHNRFPSCINSALIAKQKDLSRKPCQVLESFARLCTPMVDPTGGIHMGESVFCHSIGNITDNLDVITNAISNYRPCGKCHNYKWHFTNPTTDKEIQVYQLLYPNP